MDLREQTADARINMPLVKRDISSDISEDFTLADYLPEIRKVLYVKENLLPPAKFISGNKIDVNGVIDYTLVYVSGEGRLCSAPFSAEYSFALPLENLSDFEISEGLTVMAHSLCISSSVRVSSPRRLQLRSHIRTSVNVFGKMLCSTRICGLDGQSRVERLRKSAECAELFCESSELITLEDEYELSSPDCEVAVAEGIVSIASSSCKDDTVRVSGELCVKLAILREDKRIEKVYRKIPFEAETDLDGVELGEGVLCRAFGVLSELTVNVEEGMAKIEANIVLEVCCADNRKFEYTKDIYSTEQRVECGVRRYALPSLLFNESKKISGSDSVGAEESTMPEGAEIVDTSALAYLEKVSLRGGKYIFEGAVRYDAVWLLDGEYGVSQLKLPLVYECAAESEVTPDCFDCVCSVSDPRARREGDRLSFERDIELSATILGSCETEMLCEAEFGEKHGEAVGSFIICYPAPSDTVWSIAKRYSVLLSDVSGDPASDSFVIIEI